MEEISELYVFGDDQRQIEAKLNEFATNVKDTIDDSKKLVQQTQDNYNKLQGFVPTDISDELKSLELAAERLQSTMNDKDREFKRAKTVRSEYLSGVDYIQTWIQQTELRVQDRTAEPNLLKEHLNRVQQELIVVLEKLETVKQCAIVIIDKSRNDDEKRLVQNTVDQLAQQIEQLRLSLEEKKHQVGNAMDAWSRFMKLYETVMKWSVDKKQFLAISLNVTTLPEARQKASDYAVWIGYSFDDCRFPHCFFFFFFFWI